MRAITVLVFVLGAAGCNQLLGGKELTRSDAAGSSGSDGPGSDGPGSDGGPAYCRGSGPPILVGDGITVGDGDGKPDDICTGAVAVRTFTHALCTCINNKPEFPPIATPLFTDSFDGRIAPYSPSSAGTVGHVGINGTFSSDAEVTIGGAITVANMTGLARFHIGASVARDLDVSTSLSNSVGTITVGGDAHVAGNIVVASLVVSGTLTVPNTSTLSGAITTSATVRAPVLVAQPCGCATNDLVNIGAFVINHRTNNSNASIGLSPSRLTDYAGDVTLDLPCGIYYLGPVRGGGALVLHITGRVALLVDGDLSIIAPLTIELSTQDAELDLLIVGSVSTSSGSSSNTRIVAGDPDHPSRTRIYVGGAGTIQPSGDSLIAANVYAPNSVIESSATSTIFGSLFVRDIQYTAALTIHYDEDVLRANLGCFQ